MVQPAKSYNIGNSYGAVTWSYESGVGIVLAPKELAAFTASIQLSTLNIDTGEVSNWQKLPTQSATVNSARGKFCMIKSMDFRAGQFHLLFEYPLAPDQYPPAEKHYIRANYIFWWHRVGGAWEKGWQDSPSVDPFANAQRALDVFPKTWTMTDSMVGGSHQIYTYGEVPQTVYGVPYDIDSATRLVKFVFEAPGDFSAWKDNAETRSSNINFGDVAAITMDRDAEPITHPVTYIVIAEHSGKVTWWDRTGWVIDPGEPDIIEMIKFKTCYLSGVGSIDDIALEMSTDKQSDRLWVLSGGTLHRFDLDPYQPDPNLNNNSVSEVRIEVL